jgi:hypothetical protein
VETLEQCATDLLLQLEMEPEPTPEPTPAPEVAPLSEHDALVEKVRSMILDPTVPAGEIARLRQTSPAFAAAFNEVTAADWSAANPQAPRAEESAEVRRFAHMWNESVQLNGIQSVKPILGVCTLKLENGRKYEYPIAEFEKLQNAAAAADLLR